MAQFRVIEKLMGSAFELIVVSRDEITASNYLQAGLAEINRLEDLLSEFRESSEISRINRSAGKEPVTVSPVVFGILSRCVNLHQVTQGAFEITMGPLKKLYRFRREESSLPSREEIHTALRLVGTDKMILEEPGTVFLPLEGMRISLAAIGKGYAADCVRALWTSMGLKAGVINASGDLAVIGTKEDGKPWIAGIPVPENLKKILCYVPLREQAIATSGDTEQYFMQNGTRYSHTIDPKNGLPLTGIQSVSVVTNSAELSDALATAVYVMGRDAGLHFISQVPGAHALIVDENNEVHVSGKIEVVKN
jgi:FAD:protein FMN transferase